MRESIGASVAANVRVHSGITAGSFGVVAGVFALFFFADVPKVRTDIMQVGHSLSLLLKRRCRS